jgi:hypothetical protein
METALLPVIDINELQPTQATVNDLATAIVTAVLDGHVNPLDLPVKKKCIEQALEAALKNERVQEVIQEEIKKHGKFASHLGAKLEVVEAGVKYDFSKCGDTDLEMFESDLSTATERVKERKEFLKKLPAKGTTIVHEPSGEVITIYPPAKSSTTTIKTTMK